MDNKMSENVQDIRTSRKLHHESYEKLTGRTSCRRINPSRGKKKPNWHHPKKLIIASNRIPLSYLPRKCKDAYRFTKSLENVKIPIDLQSRKKM